MEPPKKVMKSPRVMKKKRSFSFYAKLPTMGIRPKLAVGDKPAKQDEAEVGHQDAGDSDLITLRVSREEHESIKAMKLSKESKKNDSFFRFPALRRKRGDTLPDDTSDGDDSAGRPTAKSKNTKNGKLQKKSLQGKGGKNGSFLRRNFFRKATVEAEECFISLTDIRVCDEVDENDTGVAVIKFRTSDLISSEDMRSHVINMCRSSDDFHALNALSANSGMDDQKVQQLLASLERMPIRVDLNNAPPRRRMSGNSEMTLDSEMDI